MAGLRKNVENVVKPPQNPVTKSRFSLLDKFTFPTKSPIMKQPTTLVINVAIGNFI